MTPTSTLTESRFAQFSGLISSAAKSIQRLKLARMEAFHLSAAHTNCLCRLSTEGPLTQMELARQEGMDRSQISRVLRELTSRGYVQSENRSGYKRRYQLTLSGEETAREIGHIILEVNRFVSDAIPAADLEVFYRTMRTITENLGRAVERYAAP